LKLKPPAFLMLGMVRLGAGSGYAIKKAADASTRFFWPTSLAQVYPELARLERAGLLNRRDDPHGGRSRSAYELTAAGQEALLAWLRSPQEAPTQLRDEGILRLFFADALPASEQLALVERLRERAETSAAYMRTEVLPQAEALAQAGSRYPLLAARLGADTSAYVARWLRRFEAQLEEGSEQ
jgi:DNA-binding PadR family transcriptional regulator